MIYFPNFLVIKVIKTEISKICLEDLEAHLHPCLEEVWEEEEKVKEEDSLEVECSFKVCLEEIWEAWVEWVEWAEWVEVLTLLIYQAKWEEEWEDFNNNNKVVEEEKDDKCLNTDKKNNNNKLIIINKL